MPWQAKMLATFVVAYAFSPIDLIPDFIPVLGQLDDLIIVPLGIYVTLRMIPAPVLIDARSKADAWLAANQARPRNYVAAIIFIIVWLVIAYFAFKMFFPSGPGTAPP